jgi:hypothetical protein
MVDFKFGYDTYLSSRAYMFMHAKSLFVFHDEMVDSKMKEVLMGHAGGLTYVLTDDEFYK